MAGDNARLKAELGTDSGPSIAKIAGILTAALASLACPSLFAQSSLSLSSATANPGASVTLPVSISNSGAVPSGLQWIFSYPSAAITSIAATVGPAASAAGKSLLCAGAVGSLTCLIAGFDTTGIASGVVANLQMTFSPNATTTSIGLISPVAVSAAGSSMTSPTAGGGVVSVPTLSAVTCSPSSLGQGTASTCTVTLTQTAPTGGSTVTLASSNGLLTVPATAMVTAGATTATFSTTAAASIPSNQSATVTATLGSSSQAATINLLAPVLASGVACSPANLGQSTVSTCTVTLTQTAPTGGSTVILASSNTLLTVPATVTVTAGATAATFSATAAASIPSNQSATVTAALGASSRAAAISLQAPVLVSGVACSPASLGQSGTSTCTVTLTQPTPTGGSTVILASSNTLLTVPTSVAVASGATTATFTATAAASIPSNQSATVTLGTSSQTATISLQAPVLVSGVTCSPASLGQSGTITCTVTLTQTAPTGGSTVTLASNNTSLTAPASVTVSAGATTATFSATAAASIAGNQSATVTASLGASSQTVALNLVASTATFITTDSTTGGNWISVYGSDGYHVMGGFSMNPSYVNPVPAGAQFHSWAASTADVRALQVANNPANRVAAMLDGSAFTIDLNITDSAQHQVALYSVDFDEQGRQQTVAVIDTNGNVLNSQALTSFTGGVYLVWNVTGHVKLLFTSTAGPNAVVSGLFFDAGVSPGLISGVACSPTSLSQSGASTCTVTLTQTAPAGGWGIALASNNTALSVPASVTVAAGASTASFSATAAARIAANQTATLTATLGTVSQSTTLSLLAPPPVLISGVACSPMSLGQSAVSSCTLTTTQPALTGGASVTLVSSNALLTVPATVTVTAGATTATFSATAAASIPSNESATVTATLGSSSRAATINLLAPVLVSGVVCSPANLGQSTVSTCTVTLTQTAPTGGSTVILASSNTLLTVPATVTVTAGATAATFSATAAASIPSNQSATVTATLGASSQTATISLQAQVLVSGVACSPPSLGQSGTSTCTVTTTQPALTGGSAVTLASNNTLLTVPASVTVASGATTATFTATAAASIPNNQSATVTATLGASSQTAGLSLQAPVLVSGVACSPPSLGQSGTSTCTVATTQPALTGGSTVTLASNNTLLTMPASVTVSSGSTTATFTATAAASIPGNQSATVTATMGSSSQTATISLQASVLVSGITCSPASLGQSAVSTCTVTLTQSAPANGASVTLASNNTSLTVPASLTVSAGATTGTFSATAAASIAGNQSATVTASLGASSQTVALNLVASTATFITADSTTSGNWISVYGSDGYHVMGGFSMNPSYVNPVPAGAQFHSWAASTADVRALQVANNPANRVAAMLDGSAFTIDLNITDSAQHQVALYSVDFDEQGRQQTVAVTDTNGNVLNSQALTSFTGGVYLVWNVTGHVKLLFTSTAGPNAVVSGLFFGAGVSPGLVSGVACSPTSLSQSGTSACTVTLTQTAPAGGWGIALTSNNTALTVPASVVVAAGANTASFIATAAASIPANQTVTVTATLGTSSQSTTLSLLAPPPVLVSGLACSPFSLGQSAVSTCTLTTTQPALTGGASVTLASSNALLTVPATVTVTAGATAATFSATAAASIPSNQSATVTAALGASSRAAAISLQGPVLVSGVACSPASLGQSGTSTCAVTTTQPALTGGSAVTLASNNTLLTVPASVTVASGATTATFTATAAASILNNQSATVTVTLGTSSQTAAISLQTPVLVSGVACSPPSLGQSGMSTCTVTTTQPALTGGSSVTLASNNTLLTVPASVTVASGATTATFTATAAASIPNNQSTTVTVTLGTSSQTAAISLLAPVLVSGVACSPASLGQGGTSTCTVTLTQTAPTGGSTVTLASNNTLLTMPASVTVSSGATTATFTAAAAASIPSNQSATVTATLGASSQTAAISLQASVLVSGIACSPTSLGQSAVSTCTVTLTQSAPANGASVTLASNNTSLTVPASLTVSAGATTGTFSATAAAIAGNQSATVTASLGASSQTVALNLVASTATFITADSATSGNWISVYGNDGYHVMGGFSMNPSYVNPVPAGAQFHSWAASTADVRALQVAKNPANRVAAMLDGSAFTIDLNITDSAQHQVALYSVDFDDQGRQQTVAVTDTNGNVLNSQALTSFTGGVYLVWNVTGHVKLLFTSTAGPNAVVSGLFFGAGVSPGLVSGVACSPTSLSQSGTSACTVTLTQTAPAGGWGIALTSNNTALTVPASVVVAAGANTASFIATAAASIPANQIATVTATLGTSSQTTTLSLLAPQAQPSTATHGESLVTQLNSLGCSGRLSADSAGSCQIRLAAPASQSQVIQLKSSNGSLLLPPTIHIRTGQSAVRFSIYAVPNPTDPSATVVARIPGASTEATVSLASEPFLQAPVHVNAKVGHSVQFQVTPSTPNTIVSASNLPAGAVFDGGSDAFEWLPGSSQQGRHEISFIATSSSGAVVTAKSVIEVDYGMPVVARLLNGASGSEDFVCSPGAIGRLEGKWLTAGISASDPTGNSSKLAGTTVRINGIAAPVVSASPSRVDFLCPAVAPGVKLEVVLETADAAVQGVRTVSQEAAPGIFSIDESGAGQGAVLHSTNAVAMVPNYRYFSEAPMPGDQLHIFATGIDTAAGISVIMADTEIVPRSIEPVPGMAGVYRLSVTMPSGLPAENILTFLRIGLTDGSVVTSNKVLIAGELL